RDGRLSRHAGRKLRKRRLAPSPAESVLMTEQPEKKKPPRKLGETFFYIFPQSAWPGRSTPGEPIPAKTTEVPGLIITPHDGRGKITATLTHANTGLAIGTDYESPQDADRAASSLAK